MPSDSQNSAELQTAATYANAVEKEQCISKEQAIVLDSIEGVTIEEYLIAIGNIVQPKNILYISRISQKRVCLYLNSKELVDNVVDNNVKVKIRNYTAEIRRLFTNNKRILISNVHPFIPSSLIESELVKRGITPASKITKIKATTVSSPGFSHVLSFRRQIYIKSDQLPLLPESLKINFEDSFFWIYFTTDKVVCFTCNAEGHLQKHCQNVDVSKPEQSINNQTSMETRKITNNEQNKEENIISESNISMFPPLLPHNRAKRPASTNASVISAPENKVNSGVTTTSTRKKQSLETMENIL